MAAIIVFFFSLQPTCIDLSYLKCLSMMDSHKAVEKRLTFSIIFCSGCKESQLYSLHTLAWKPFWLTPIFFYGWDWLQFFCNLNSLKNFNCQPGKLKTQFTSPIIKSSTQGLLPGHYSVYSLCTLFNVV